MNPNNNNLKRKRFEKFQTTLKEKKFDGAIITSKVNLQYLLGFYTESPTILFVPAKDSKVSITIFTTPLEEEIVKSKIPFNDDDEIKIIVMIKSLSPRSVDDLKNNKFKKIIFSNDEIIIPNSILKNIYKKSFDSRVSAKFSSEEKDLDSKSNSNLNFNPDIPEIKLDDILKKAVKKNELMISKWNSKQVLVPRVMIDQMLAELIMVNKLKKVGIENKFLTYENYLKLSNAIKKSKLKLIFNDISEILQKQCLFKDPDEIENLKKAAEIGDIGFAAAKKAIHELKTENEVQAIAEFEMKRAGSKKPSFDTIVVSGENSAHPHGHATDKKIEKGDLVTVDIGAIYNGYCSDMTRTIIAGHETTEEKERILTLTNQAHKIGLKAIKPGAKWADPDIAVRKFFKDNNVLQYYVHSLGHGVGIQIHEAPWISYRQTKKGQIIKKGMVFTNEPGLYIPGIGGARTEDTLVVTEDGYEILNKSEYTYYD